MQNVTTLTNNIMFSLTVKAADIENNVVDENIVYGCIDDPNMPNLEEIVYFDDDEEVGAEADMKNLAINMPVSPILTTRCKIQNQHKEFWKKVWTLVELPYGKRAIGTKWVYINKKDNRVARIEAIRLFLAYASFMNFIVYQMDVKSAFLYGTIEEEVYVCQPPGFEDPEFPTKFTLLDDIMFAVCACTRFQVTPKTSHLHAVKRIFRYLKGHPKLGLWYPRDSPFDLEAFSDSDYAGASLDRKSTTGGCQFLGRRLISWQCKKQTIVANSTTEAEYVAAANCCGQVLWIQNQLLDYGYNFMNTKIFIDNESTICIVKNPVFHSKTKHIEIRHHFIRDSYEKRLIQVIKIHTDHSVADLLTKAFDISRFQYLIANVGEGKAKRTTEISQSSGPFPLVTYETVIKEGEDRMERAATTASSLEAEQDSGNIKRTQSMATLNESFPQGTDLGCGPRCQDTILGGAEAQIRFEAASKQSNDLPLSRVNTLGSGEDNMKLKKLMELCHEKLNIKHVDPQPLSKEFALLDSVHSSCEDKERELLDQLKEMERERDD
ncbi:putative ribonuclease H-like domain-containing protein [Tanacetum coccineum]